MRAQDDVGELFVEEQRLKNHPMYIARMFDDWTTRTGIMDGSGLSWVGHAVVGIILIIPVSILYWLLLGRRTMKEAENANR